jgi:hypothetical protein
MRNEREHAMGLLVYSRSGSSLVELIGAMAAGLVVLGASLQALSYFQQEFTRQHDEITQQQDVRLGLELLEQELRLACLGSLSVIRPDAVEFMANINGLMTNLTASPIIGQTTIAVEDGRGWPDNKLVRVCWNEQCEQFTLARAGQRSLLTLVEPVARPIPTGASVVVMNRVRYYSRFDERGALRFLRQVDGGASVLVGNVESVTFSYWDERGLKTTEAALVRRIVVAIVLPHQAATEQREISLRT